jgi:hypothetical protein
MLIACCGVAVLADVVWGGGGFFVLAPVLFWMPGSSFSFLVVVSCCTVISVPSGEIVGVSSECLFLVLFVCPCLWFLWGLLVFRSGVTRL